MRALKCGGVDQRNQGPFLEVESKKRSEDPCPASIGRSVTASRRLLTIRPQKRFEPLFASRMVVLLMAADISIETKWSHRFFILLGSLQTSDGRKI